MKLKINKKEYKIIEAKYPHQRLKGLMFKKNINYGMLFKKCNAIHTYFMKENIDIVGLDENNEVIYKYENLEPNRIITIKNKQNKTSILELPQNTSKNIKIGQILLFESEHIL